MNLDRKPIKLYKVIFNEYTNCMNNYVSVEMEYKECDLNDKLVDKGSPFNNDAPFDFKKSARFIPL